MWYVEAGRGTKLPLTPEEGAGSEADKAAKASHVGSYSIRTEMRRSVYQRTFLAHSNLYRGAERRQSTLPGHIHISSARPVVPYVFRNETRPVPLRFSCSEASHSLERPSPRPYRSAENDLDAVEFPLRIKKDLSSETFRRSQDSDSSSYISPKSHRSVSYQQEDIEMDVFSRQSSEGSEELSSRRKPRPGRLLSFQNSKLEEDEVEMETFSRCVSEGDTESAMKTAPTSFSEVEVDWQSNKGVLSKNHSTDNEGTLSRTTSETGRGEGYEFAMKQFESFDEFCRGDLSQRDSDENSEESRSNKTESDVYHHTLFPWKKDYSEDYDRDNLATNREDGTISFKFDVLSQLSDKDPDSSREQSQRLNFRSGLFPGRRKSGGIRLNEVDEGATEEDLEKDEGFDLQQGTETNEDLFGSQLDLRRREAFRKERSLDSDETSGFVSKHSSETTDLSSKLSSTQFTSKHFSEPLGFGVTSPTSVMPQHLSEPTDFGSKKFLTVDLEPTSGVISKKREHFRKSKRLKHFNLRRIDDTDNDSSCDSDKPPVSAEEPPEPPSTRLKEEVGLPKHLSRDSSVDRYGLYKSRSEKTITSFESDKIGQARLYDFESFCEAVTFSKSNPTVRQKAASADETEISDDEVDVSRAVIRRKSRSKRDISRRLKCLLL